MLELDDVTVKVGPQVLARNLSVALAPGEINVVIGPNGTGKTSLLRTLFGELPPAAGQIRLNGQAMPRHHLGPWRKQFGYMPQDTGLDLDLSVLEVVLMGKLDHLGMHVDDATLMEALEALRAVGLVALADRAVHSLSGGQRQMVLFAQVLLRAPLIMLLDEPVSALDLKHQVLLLDLLHRQTRKNGWITVVVLHDLNLAAQYGDRLVVLAHGTLQAFGTPADVLTAELVQRLYGVAVDVVHDRFGDPHIRPIRERSLHPVSLQQEAA